MFVAANSASKATVITVCTTSVNLSKEDHGNLPLESNSFEADKDDDYLCIISMSLI